jgi:hypothetical protein
VYLAGKPASSPGSALEKSWHYLTSMIIAYSIHISTFGFHAVNFYDKLSFAFNLNYGTATI